MRGKGECSCKGIGWGEGGMEYSITIDGEGVGGEVDELYTVLFSCSTRSMLV